MGIFAGGTRGQRAAQVNPLDLCDMPTLLAPTPLSLQQASLSTGHQLAARPDPRRQARPLCLSASLWNSAPSASLRCLLRFSPAAV